MIFFILFINFPFFPCILTFFFFHHTSIPIPTPLILFLFFQNSSSAQRVVSAFIFLSSSLALSFSHTLTLSHTHYRWRTKPEFKAMMLKMAVAEFKACFAQEKCEQETLQCSLLVEKHCSNSKKNGNGEAVGVSFWGVFSLKMALKKPQEILLVNLALTMNGLSKMSLVYILH